MQRKIFIHPGFPKTATTSLQSYFFPKICKKEGWEYFGKKYDASGKYIKDERLTYFLELLRTKDVLYFTQNKKEIIKNIIGDEKSNVILSLETIISDSLRTFKLRETSISLDIYTTIKKLSTLFNSNTGFSPYILLVIRKQEELIPSWYAQAFTEEFSKINEINTLNKFVKKLQNDSQYKYLFSPMYYDLICNEFENLFGKEFVKILTYEELVMDYRSFTKKILDFLNVEVIDYKIGYSNIRKEKLSWRTKKPKLPRFLLTPLTKIKSIIPLPVIFIKYFKVILNNLILKHKEIHISENERRIIRDNYKKSNKTMNEKYNLRLEYYNYY